MRASSVRRITYLAGEQAADRTAGQKRWRIAAPGGRYTGLIGNVELAIQHLDADVEMVIRQDAGDLRRHRLNDGIEIELPRQKPGNIQIVIQKAFGLPVIVLAILLSGREFGQAFLLQTQVTLIFMRLRA